MPTPPRRGHARTTGPLTDRLAGAAEPPRQTLYTHAPHPHMPQNATARAQAEREAHAAQHTGWRGQVAQVNLALAVWLTRHTGSMLCAYLFAGIGVGSLIGVFTNNTFLAALCGSVSSYFLQLVLLPVISTGQNVLSRHAELQADEQFHATLRAVHEGEQVARHLDAQDAELLRQTQLLTTLVERQIAAAASGAVAPPIAPQPLAPVAPSAPSAPRRRRAPASLSEISPASP